MIETMIEIIGMMIWNHIIMSLYVSKNIYDDNDACNDEIFMIK